MSEDSRAVQMQKEADAGCVVPSVKEILDSVAAETGLSTFDDDTFRSGLKVSTARIDGRICPPACSQLFLSSTLTHGTRHDSSAGCVVSIPTPPSPCTCASVFLPTLLTCLASLSASDCSDCMLVPVLVQTVITRYVRTKYSCLHDMYRQIIK